MHLKRLPFLWGPAILPNFEYLRMSLQIIYLIPDICYDIKLFGYTQPSYFMCYIVFARYVFQERKLGTADTDT